jgi:phage terminase large subunit GpA-like protein
MPANPSVLDKIWWKGFKPDPILTVSEWADKNRILSRKTSSEAGQWRTSRTPYLKEVMDVLGIMHPAKKIIFMKASQVGAPLDIETPIPTPNGYIKMGDLSPGDLVFDEQGRPQKVEGVSEIFYPEQCYQIIFDEGSTITCDGRHLWTVERSNSKAAYTELTINTDEIFKDYKTGNRRKYRIKNCQAIKGREDKLPIGPYTLGAWLGDGNRNGNRITTHYLDAQEMAQHIEAEGYVTKVEQHADTAHEIVIDPTLGDENFCVRGHSLIEEPRHPVYKYCPKCHRERAYAQRGYAPRPKARPRRFGELIVSENLRKNKHIPAIYLRSNVANRLQLLRGLMDTDGSCTKKGLCEFYSCDQALALSVFELAVSLGLKVRMRVRQPNTSIRPIRGKTIQSKLVVYVVYFTAPKDLVVFNLKRKIKNQTCRINIRPDIISYRRIQEIIVVPGVPTRCISVSGKSHLFLAGKSFIPTHNTECGNNWLGYIIDHAPSPSMMILPTIEMAKRSSKMRLDPLIEDSPSIRRKVRDPKSRSGGNTILQKEFEHGYLVLTGGNSATGLRSMPAKNLIIDEADAFPADVGGEGSPISIVMARSRTFSRRKAFIISTPTIEGASIISDEFENSDKRFYQVPCPHCQAFQVLKFKQLQWPPKEPEKAEYFCEKCGEAINERFKTDMLERGKWVAENPKSEVVGFHISALYSPVGWFSWVDIAKEFYLSKKDPTKMRAFTNTILGETWKDRGDAPAWRALYLRRELYPIGECPAGVVFLTCGVDVQKEYLAYEIVGWGRNQESWSIQATTIQGETDHAEVWDELSKVLSSTYKSTSGAELAIQLTCIDSGFNTQHVYNYCRQYPANRVIPIKGRDDMAITVGRPREVDVKLNGKTIRKGVRLWPLGVSHLKAQVYSALGIEPPTENEKASPFFCHFPQYDEDFFKQLTAEEVRTKKNSRNFTSSEWVKIRERNEFLDCRAYNRAAASIVGIDRFKEEEWFRLETEGSRGPIAKKLDNPQNKVETSTKTKKTKRAKRESFW